MPASQHRTRVHTRTRRLLAATAGLAALAVLATGCASTGSSAAENERPRVGIVLGGGGEVGIAWQTGVLAALAEDAQLTPEVVDVVVGTSAGAYAGAYFSLGTDLDALVEAERSGDVPTAPVGEVPEDGAESADPIPPEIMAALMSQEGTVEERGRRIGTLAMAAETSVSREEYVAHIASALPSAEWPALDFRPTSVNAATGRTVLWTAADEVPLADALASSSAVPGFLPTVEIDGAHYTDAPRTSFSASLVEEKDLDAIVYIGMPNPTLSNTVEEEALDALERGSLQVARITGGADARKANLDALDPGARPVAVEAGLRDGAAAAAEVAALLR